MKYLRSVILLFIPLSLLISCSEQSELEPVPEGIQGYSLLGDTLETPEISQEMFDEQNEKLIQALTDYRANPDDADAIIWLGRRTAYLGEYREAIRIFTEGISKFPDDPRMSRHRGHRYITLRRLDLAIEDFEKAKELMSSMPDQVEPDGLPNELNQPTSTLKSNIYYHKGLAHYLKGEYDLAIQEYEESLKLDLTDDMRIALIYWYYMALKRSGNDLKAGEIIEPVNADINLIENEAYLNLILVFKGVFDSNRLMETSEDALENATLGYGIGNWHYINGREERAISIWENVYDTDQWAAFGYIASEAELARIGSSE
ncbi:tetratricopeptide repeat protein [Rhodohalobacter sp. 614A]|uniref:tetratricopeptide repeat protein n=1 Tax=Rhodohalobacter sp. 614A TaxID=2908649 RepID=UPI001F40FB2D|nr:tetratricopeptide repeat protein [Rhodohalobacter sp. 614A]